MKKCKPIWKTFRFQNTETVLLDSVSKSELNTSSKLLPHTNNFHGDCVSETESKVKLVWLIDIRLCKELGKLAFFSDICTVSCYERTGESPPNSILDTMPRFGSNSIIIPIFVIKPSVRKPKFSLEFNNIFLIGGLRFIPCNAELRMLYLQSMS